ncbi:hypothetical protein H8356DRAFT_1639627 [Neocallimastix lanati (nom. inval.)]|nr:hypothetical protein H8356DRAFT_1639627 [Neocallimastix sp. JGI-2020a]
MEKKKELTENEEYKIEKILDKKIKKEHTYYLVKWSGNDEMTWEPEENLDNYLQLVEEYNSNNDNNNNPFQIDSKSMQLKLSRNKEKKNNNERMFINLNSENNVSKVQEEIFNRVENELLKLSRYKEKLIHDKIIINNSNSKNVFGKVIDDKFSEKEFSFRTQEKILDRIENELLKLGKDKEKLKKN